MKSLLLVPVVPIGSVFALLADPSHLEHEKALRLRKREIERRAQSDDRTPVIHEEAFLESNHPSAQWPFVAFLVWPCAVTNALTHLPSRPPLHDLTDHAGRVRVLCLV